MRTALRCIVGNLPAPPSLAFIIADFSLIVRSVQESVLGMSSNMIVIY
jgi:hypothetical protein